MTPTEVLLVQAETDAAEQGLRVEALLRDREYPNEIVALATIIDRARDHEHWHKMYDLPTLAEQAVMLRESLSTLVKSYDAMVTK